MPEVSSKIEKTGLGLRQSMFVQAYADPNSETCGNAYQSALAANYSKATAKQACVILVENCRIKPAIDKYLADIKAKAVATRQKRQQFWTETMDETDKTKCNMGDRLRASELLGKSEADFTENVNIGEKTVIIIGPKRPKQVESEVIENG